MPKNLSSRITYLGKTTHKLSLKEKPKPHDFNFGKKKYLFKHQKVLKFIKENIL